jgi:glucose-6-phosphate isomerase, archaeal
VIPVQIDLSDAAGLPIALDLESGTIVATGDVDLGEQGERRLSQLLAVLAEPEAATDDRICYRTYRGVGTKADRELLNQHGLRYDLTVTLPGLIGREFTKTAGHRHATNQDGVVYPEVYEVVHGQAAFVLQATMQDYGLAPVVAGGWVQTCGPGDRIFIWPSWDHVTVNIGREPLVVCDLIASACTNDYGSLRTAHGAGYYIVSAGDSFSIEPNPHYGYLPAAIIGHGSRWPEILPTNAPLIELFRRDPKAFRILTEPIEFEDEDWGWG